MFLAWSGMQLEEVALIDDLDDQLLDIVGLVRIVGHQASPATFPSDRPCLRSGTIGGFSLLLEGRKPNRRRVIISASTSFSNERSATPDLVVCVIAPPSSSAVTSSCVTVFTTSGPVTNMYEESLTMKMKSVIAGEYTAPPAQGPMISGDLGNDAGGQDVPLEDVGITAQRGDAFLDARAAGVVQPDHRRADLHA